MHRVATDQSAELLESVGGIESLEFEIQGALELLTGKACLNRGDLEEAARLFAAAREHLVDAAQKRELCSQLVRLARALVKRKDQLEPSPTVESVLRAAATLDPIQALPALAQYFQSEKRFADAIVHWKEAIGLNPGESGYYMSLARVLDQSGEPGQALATYLELIEAAPTAGNYLTVYQRLESLASKLPEAEASRTIKVALLGNATLDHLRSYITVECFRAGLRLEVYQSGFDLYSQDILDPQSELYAFSPDVVICAIHSSRLFPRIHHYPFALTIDERRAEIESGLNTLQTLLDTFTARNPALVLVHNMVAPQFPALGILDWRNELGQAEMFGQINARLAALVRGRYKSVYIVDEDRIQARAGKAGATDPRLWLTARLGWSEGVLSALAKEYLRYVTAYKGLSRKCIVLDLDNTLWGGVVGEDGIAGLQLGQDSPGNGFVAFQRELERLWRRGILLAVASKNNQQDVLPVFERHSDMVLGLEHFAAQRINWEPKSDNIRSIARELNIGLDSIVFLDDNPVERAKVRAELPQVLTPELPTDPAYFRYALLNLGVFDTLALTDEDQRRNQLYAEQKARRDFEVEYEAQRGSLEEYLAALEMVVEIEPVNDRTISRIAQLTGKTNQFNLTTRRYTEAHIGEMQARGCEIYGVRVRDRFGDNGVVGAAILLPHDADTWELDTLLLSCRVMGRGVETAFLTFVANHVREHGIRFLQGWYLPTAKNSPVKDVYREHGFTLVEDHTDGRELWRLDVAGSVITAPTWLTVRTTMTSCPRSPVDEVTVGSQA